MDYNADHEKRREKRFVWILLGLVLAGLLICWMVQELRFRSHTVDSQPISQWEALVRFPTLKLTDAEIALADAALPYTAEQEETVIELPWEQAAPIAAPVLPEGAEDAIAFTGPTSFGLEYWHDDLRYILTYPDSDRDGKPDSIYKVVSKPEPRDKDFCHVSMDLATGECSYAIARYRKNWFAFLDR